LSSVDNGERLTVSRVPISLAFSLTMCLTFMLALPCYEMLLTLASAQAPTHGRYPTFRCRIL
jgi:hypothetical protein